MTFGLVSELCQTKVLMVLAYTPLGVGGEQMSLYLHFF